MALPLPLPPALFFSLWGRFPNRVPHPLPGNWPFRLAFFFVPEIDITVEWVFFPPFLLPFPFFFPEIRPFLHQACFFHCDFYFSGLHQRGLDAFSNQSFREVPFWSSQSILFLAEGGPHFQASSNGKLGSYFADARPLPLPLWSRHFPLRAFPLLSSAPNVLPNVIVEFAVSGTFYPYIFTFQNRTFWPTLLESPCFFDPSDVPSTLNFVALLVLFFLKKPFIKTNAPRIVFQFYFPTLGLLFLTQNSWRLGEASPPPFFSFEVLFFLFLSSNVSPPSSYPRMDAFLRRFFRR